MKFSPRISALALAAATALSGGAIAQCDLGGAGVEFRINGVLPSVANPLTHEVDVGGGTTMTFSVAGAIPGTPFILAGGSSVSCGAIPIPSVGSVDLAGAYVLLDGLSGGSALDALAITNFSITLPLASGCGPVGAVAPALQAIYIEPANPPFNLEITQAGQAVKTGTVTTTITTLTDDSFVTVPLNCQPITFGGVARTQVQVSSNGVLTFTTGVTDFTPSLAEFHHGFRLTGTAGTNPGVSAYWTDLNPALSALDSVVVTQDSNLGTVTVAYLNQVHISGGAAAGSWTVTFGTFGANTVTVDYTAALAPPATYGVLFGVTDGVDTVGSNTSIDISAAIPYTSPAGTPDSIGELLPVGTAVDVPTINYLDALGNYEWFIF